MTKISENIQEKPITANINTLYFVEGQDTSTKVTTKTTNFLLVCAHPNYGP